MFLSDFESVRPTFVLPQKEGLNWLAQAHARKSTDVSAERFTKLIARYGCSEDKIAQRASFLRDFTHTDWDKMALFGENAATLEARMAFFNEALVPAIDRLYSKREADFASWIHVTCTGYVSPSVVQTLTSIRGWGERVRCLHAYHMGCYAAMPAIRMAKGNGESEILHTELCTLHLDPAKHDPEQLVIQSLFADGVIRYRAGEKRPARGFSVEDLREHIAPASLTHMTWGLGTSQFTMTLAREVPKSVQEAVGAIVKPWQTPQTVYAIHPGGPRIIDAVKDALQLSEEQVTHSRDILREHGNMSSATLPHVWAKMLGQIPRGTPVISMAFGPGLTVSTSLMVSR